MSLGALESYGCVDSFPDTSSVPGAPTRALSSMTRKNYDIFWFFPQKFDLMANRMWGESCSKNHEKNDLSPNNFRILIFIIVTTHTSRGGSLATLETIVPLAEQKKSSFKKSDFWDFLFSC